MNNLDVKALRGIFELLQVCFHVSEFLGSDLRLGFEGESTCASPPLLATCCWLSSLLC